MGSRGPTQQHFQEGTAQGRSVQPSPSLDNSSGFAPTVAKLVGSGDALKTREPRVGLLTQASRIRSWLGSGWKVRVGDLLDFPAQSWCAGRFMNLELTRSGGETVAVWPSGPNFLLQCARHLLKQGPSPKSSELSNTQDKG